MFRFLAFFCCLCAILAIRTATPFILDPAKPSQIKITATPVSLSETDPRANQLGELHFEAGWALQSDDAMFGSLSGLVIEGNRFVSISDYGVLTRFDLKNGSLDPLPRGCGLRPYKWAQDAEALARATDGTLYIGLEVLQAICTVKAGSKVATQAQPAAMAKWRPNGGPESIALTHDGGLVVIEENRIKGDQPRDLLYFAKPPTRTGPEPVKLGYVPPEGFSPTDVNILPDGRLLVLNRNFNAIPFGFTAVLVVVEKPVYRADTVLRGREIARFVPPVLSDNFEGLATRKTPEGTEIWILSDDNFFPLQQTLLLKFNWKG